MALVVGDDLKDGQLLPWMAAGEVGGSARDGLGEIVESGECSYYELYLASCC